MKKVICFLMAFVVVCCSFAQAAVVSSGPEEAQPVSWLRARPAARLKEIRYVLFFTWIISCYYCRSFLNCNLLFIRFTVDKLCFCLRINKFLAGIQAIIAG